MKWLINLLIKLKGNKSSHSSKEEVSCIESSIKNLITNKGIRFFSVKLTYQSLSLETKLTEYNISCFCESQSHETKTCIFSGLGSHWELFFYKCLPKYIAFLDYGGQQEFRTKADFLNAIHESNLEEYNNYTKEQWKDMNRNRINAEFVDSAELLYKHYIKEPRLVK